MKVEQIERKQMEILHIAEIQERNGERKMKSEERKMLNYLEKKYYVNIIRGLKNAK